MSNLAPHVTQPCDVDSDCGMLEKLLKSREKDLGGFTVRRLLPTSGQKMLGPWVFFDHMGPANFPPGKGVNVRPHPHIGIATVTYLFEGEILHRDSLGSCQPIVPGDINLMVAGRGITHSERERPEVREKPHRAHGLQLWLALPDDQEDIEPAFHHYPAATIPAVDIAGVAIRVMMGNAYGVRSPVKTFSDTLYIEARLERGQTLELPDAEDLGMYVAEGALRIGDTRIPRYCMGIAGNRRSFAVEAEEHTRLAMIGGKRLSPRFIDWNFVSSRKERIEAAKRDWQEGRFADVVGDEEDFIPLPE